MGLLAKSFKTSKFKILANLAIVRIAYLMKQHQVRCSQAESDVIQFLKLGDYERSLLPVEHFIREQNKIDAYAMIESYCLLLIERVKQIQENKVCPDELKEAIASLHFAASRCSELSELHEIHRLFVSKFGKELANRAAELRNNCGVSPKIVRKLSTQCPSLDSKRKTLEEIALRSGITRQHKEESRMTAPQKKLEKLPGRNATRGDESILGSGDDTTRDWDAVFNEKMEEARKKYHDVGAAAQAAFELASRAAAAAKAAEELSLSLSHPRPPRA